MISFQINNQYLAIEDNTSVTIDIVNPIFIDDADVLQGSYSFPFQVMLDSQSRKILRYPDRIDTLLNFPVFDNSTLYIEGKPLFTGKILVLSSNEKTAKLVFVTNELLKLTDKKINELNLGLFPEWTTTQQVLDYMVESVVSPSTKPASFIPVFNPDYYDPEDLDPSKINATEEYWMQRFQNYYTVDPDIPKLNNTFVYNKWALAITPFVRLKNIWDEIFADFGIQKIDTFFTNNPQLERIYLYNNKSINSQTEITSNQFSVFGPNTLTNIDRRVQSYVPAITCKELIKRVRSLFFLAVLPDPLTKQVTVIPIKEILSSAVAKEWTSKLLIDYENDNENILPKLFAHEYPAQDLTFQTYSNEYGLYPNYNIQRNATFETLPTATSLVVPFTMSFLPLRFSLGQKDPYITKLTPLYNSFPLLIAKEFGTPIYTMPNNPYVRMRGSIKFKNFDDKDKEYNTPLTDTRLIYYRGFADAKSRLDTPDLHDIYYPYATPGEHLPEQDPTVYTPHTDDFSLLWNGPKGIYEQWAKEYIDILQSHRFYKCKIALNIVDILNFKYQDKIKIRSNNFLLKTMRITFTKQGIQPAECTFVRVK